MENEKSKAIAECNELREQLNSMQSQTSSKETNLKSELDSLLTKHSIVCKQREELESSLQSAAQSNQQLQGRLQSEVEKNRLNERLFNEKMDDLIKQHMAKQSDLSTELVEIKMIKVELEGKVEELKERLDMREEEVQL
jgi:hypothetical protein